MAQMKLFFIGANKFCLFWLELIGTRLAETAARKSAAMAMAHAMELDRATFLQTLRAPQHGVRRGFGKVE